MNKNLHNFFSSLSLRIKIPKLSRLAENLLSYIVVARKRRGNKLEKI